MPIVRDPEPVDVKPAKQASNKKVEKFINEGGAPTAKGKNADESRVTKSIKLIMTGDEMETIKELRDKRPHRSRKITISVHDWVIEAIQEKIDRERKKYAAQ